ALVGPRPVYSPSSATTAVEIADDMDLARWRSLSVPGMPAPLHASLLRQDPRMAGRRRIESARGARVSVAPALQRSSANARIYLSSVDLCAGNLVWARAAAVGVKELFPRMVMT